MEVIEEDAVWAEALRAAPDPERARKLAEKVLAAVPPERLDAAARPEALARVLGAICGMAPYLASHVVRHPDWLLDLLDDDLDEPLEWRALEGDLASALAGSPDATAPDEAERVLREFKYQRLTRITVRETDESLVPFDRSGETLTELSLLADALLGGALTVARARVEARLGPPRWRDRRGREHEAGFVVLALGKLGGEELNYSSDVDLVYVHESVADAASGPQEQSPSAWFTRLAQEFGRIVGGVTADGFLYRVDLDLRPEGTQGPLVLSDGALHSYYETAAEAWEKVAFMKARPAAGDLALGWRAIRAVHPMIYQASMDYAGVRRIKELKEKIGAAQRKTSGGEGFNVKLDPGGIRDLEFLAQAMQLLHGGRIPQLRDRSTQRTLVALGEVKLLARETVAELLHAYHFLRRVENRLQMEEERQVHRVPSDEGARLRLARAMGFQGDQALAAFDAALAAEREKVLAFAASPAFEERSEAILDLFARHEPRLVALPAMRAMMETLAEQFAREIEASPAPALALNNLDRFIEGLGGRRFYYELLLDRPELVPRLAALFASSRFLSAYLASHPRLIEPVFENPERLLLSREELRADLAAIRAELGGEDEEDFQQHLDALRLFHHRQVLNVGLLEVGEHVTRAEAEGALTEVAEVTLESALALARREQERTRPAPESVGDAAFLVVGMGKLASRELGYGSDLDLVFFYDVPDQDPVAVAEAQDHFARLTQRLISAIQTPTAEGSCYEIDARLRPSGRQGSLVTSLASFRRYHEREAQVWERQVLLRARAVAGDAKLAEAFEAERRTILRRPLPEDAAGEIHRIRLRMESELAEETRERRDLKTGRGGLLDVENAVQYLQLRHGREHEELLEVARIEDQIDRLESLALVSREHAEALREGWEFLQRLAGRLRIVENRSMSELDAERGDLDGLALRLGYPAGGRESGPRRALLRDYARHTDKVRGAYLAILQADRQSA